MRTLVWTFWLIFEWAHWRNAVQSVPMMHSTTKNLYSALYKTLENNAANCTKYIPEKWQQWMRDNSITKEVDLEQTMGSEYLLACLNRELENVKVNETSPFSLSDQDNISYSMALNEVVSLGFDGILISKA